MTADFIVRQSVMSEASLYLWLQWANAEAKERGVSFVRLSHAPEKPLDIWYEGWLVKPEDQGPEPWRRRFDISKEWCRESAQIEGDAEVGAGLLARNPEEGKQ